MAIYKVYITDDTETVEPTARPLTLREKATVEDMKTALGSAEGFQNPQTRYRIYYRKPTHEEPLDDDDILTDIVKDDGHFVAEISKLGPMDGLVDLIYDDQSQCGNAIILMGSPKKFEHFILNHEKNKVKVIDGKLPVTFKWLNNKLAVVEEETNAEYIAYQYFIRNKWTLKVIQNPKPGTGPKWILKKKNENGDFVTLFGKQKSYPECKEKIPKRILK